MVETYSSRPFISHDGPDENGFRAEVKVVTGFGRIESVQPSKAGKSAKVSFSVENTEYSPAAWAPVDGNVMKVVEEAQESGEPIHFRIETRRQDKIDRTIPIAEISDLAKARDSIHKSLAAVKREDDTDWTISPFAKTNMAEDPRTGPSASANDYTLEELRAMGGASNTSNRGGGSYSGSGEPAPYITRLRSGELNPGSIAVSVPLNIYSFVNDYLREHKLSLEDEKQLERAKFMATRVIMSACNDAQLAIYEGYEQKLEEPDLSAGSHTRARALIFETVRTFFPLSEELLSDPEKLEEWGGHLLQKAVNMWRWSLREVENLTES